ncbi:Transposable element Tcb1 transposase [Daphnia sinensis]|uniref:Transposable element Tcb1 transposase n=1 Tax=Daphnia sinensis TaxID=1820382 RepID=A0AAD5PUW2_9CRUS|nr:Transposable element Tcb1 transposase [Daphnia sinensis]
MDGNVQSPRLTESEKGILIGYHLSGYNVTEISHILGRSRVTVYKWIKRFQEEAILSPFDTVDEIRESAEAINIANRTVRSRLFEAGLRARAPSVKNFLKEMHRVNRVKFATEHFHYNLDFWSKVIWSDEKTFISSGCPPQYSTRKSLNVWGYVTFDGPGVLHKIIGKLNSRQYLEILQTKMPFKIFRCRA